MQTRVFRSAWAIMLAYIVSPIIGLSVLWLLLLVYDATGNDFNFLRDAFLAPWLLVVGWPIAIVAELVFVSPLLVGFHRRRWKWLNPWSACSIGFLMSALPWFALCVWAISKGDPPKPTWADAAVQSAGMGLVGLVAALAFGLIAFRNDRSVSAVREAKTRTAS